MPLFTKHNRDHTASGVLKFGQNTNIDINSVPETVWSPGGLYVFPAAAGAGTMVSDSADDAMGGIGAHTVRMRVLDGDWKEHQLTLQLNGLTPVNLPLNILRCDFLDVVDVGSNQENVGTIQVLHGATLLAQIDPGMGGTLMAVFSTASNKPKIHGLRFYADLESGASGARAQFEIRARPFEQAWRVAATGSSTTDGGKYENEPTFSFPLPPRTDIELRCVLVSSNGTTVNGGFDLRYE